jgi:3-oxoadipate enol-lactonase
MAQLNFVREGSGPAVVLSHALGTDLTMWDEVAAQLAQRFTVLRYDHRGHGRSPAVPGRCTMEDLAEDAAELIREELGGPVHFVGISMGGMVGQQLAASHPELVGSMVVANAMRRS